MFKFDPDRVAALEADGWRAYYDRRWTAGVKITSVSGTAELISIYPPPVHDWINRHGGLTSVMKRVFNGRELWAIVDPCPDAF